MCLKNAEETRQRFLEPQEMKQYRKELEGYTPCMTRTTSDRESHQKNLKAYFLTLIYITQYLCSYVLLIFFKNVDVLLQ